jgi:ferredoxin
MKLRHLKKVRVVVSLLMFVPAAFLFLDLKGALPPGFVAVLTALQAGPALVASATSVGWGLAGLVCIVLLTLTFGRIYCSTLCPLGTLQDLIGRLNRTRNSRRRFKYRTPNSLLHVGLLLLVTVLGLGGSVLLLNLLEPFSIFGRTMTILVRPLAAVANNGIAILIGTFAEYSVDAYPARLPDPLVLILPLLFLAALAFMSYRSGRLFCNTLCPVGALLGLVSRFSIFRIVFDRSACLECGLCEKVCKSECIDSRGMRVDFSACVGCFNCMEVCPTAGVKFARGSERPGSIEGAPVSRRRRRMLKGAASSVAAVAMIPSDTVRTAIGMPSGRSRSLLPVTPPGSLGIEHLTASCTACHLCVSACPTQVLVPSFMEYGLDGILQPRLEYAAGACTYECVLCSQVCPNGAILPLTAEVKKLVQVGKARFIKDECIVVTKKTNCGACAEHCPTKAVRMVKYEGKLVIPELNNDLCVGCGACEHPCPTTPEKAIYVESNPVHLAAKKPETKKPEQEPVPSTEFPF